MTAHYYYAPAVRIELTLRGLESLVLPLHQTGLLTPALSTPAGLSFLALRTLSVSWVMCCHAALPRFELRITDSESVVLPLHYRALL